MQPLNDRESDIIHAIIQEIIELSGREEGLGEKAFELWCREEPNLTPGQAVEKARTELANPQSTPK